MMPIHGRRSIRSFSRHRGRRRIAVLEGPGGSMVDPEWGRIDPAAGDWFPEMALDLASNADPGL